MFTQLFGSNSTRDSFSSRSASHGGGGQSGAPAYSFARLQQLYERLSRFKESDLEKSGGGDAVVETVRQITEALIWGEQNDAHLFDFFCEKSILADFVRVLGLPKAPKKVKLQLLQTLQMLVQNIRQKTSVYYLLSNNHVNRLIATPFDLGDEEVLAYYVTLLKSLALRLDTETINFFFVQRNEATFPLYIEATKLFNHRDQMVRASVRTITLQVYRIRDEPMQQFVLRHAAESYFSQLALHLRDLWLRLDVAVAGASKERNLAAIQSENELQQDLQIYLSDVFELEVAALNEVLADRLLNCVMLPVLLAGLFPTRALRVGESHETQRALAPVVALFLLRQVLDTFKSRVLLEPLFSDLLQPSLPAALAYVLPQCAEAASPPGAALPPDFVGNSIRRHFLGLLTSGQEAHALLSSAVVHGCVFNEAAACRHLIEASASEVLAELLQTLRFCASWQTETLQVHISAVLEVLLESARLHGAEVRDKVLRSVESCLGAAAGRWMEFLQAAAASDCGSDGALDVFAEEWEAHRAPWLGVQQYCGSPRRLFPLPPQDGSAEARRAAAAFLLSRRLRAALERAAEQAPESGGEPLRFRAEHAEEPTPLQVEDQAGSAVTEGMSYPMGGVEKIVCGVASPNGKCTRYLLLHDHWLLLVQPDISAPGWAVVKTARPIWQVQSLADRSDPRTLQLALPMPPGSRRGGDSSPGASCEFMTMTLNFEDVKRAHSAVAHLERRRQDVRAKLLRKAIDFVGESLDGLPRQSLPATPAM